MELTISKIGSESALGNVTVTMQRPVEIETELGTAVMPQSYRIIVKADTLKKGEGETVNLDTESESAPFKVETRPYIIPEGEENAGTTVMLRWIVPNV